MASLVQFTQPLNNSPSQQSNENLGEMPVKVGSISTLQRVAPITKDFQALVPSSTYPNSNFWNTATPAPLLLLFGSDLLVKSTIQHIANRYYSTITSALQCLTLNSLYSTKETISTVIYQTQNVVGTTVPTTILSNGNADDWSFTAVNGQTYIFRTMSSVIPETFATLEHRICNIGTNNLVNLSQNGGVFKEFQALSSHLESFAIKLKRIRFQLSGALSSVLGSGAFFGTTRFINNEFVTPTRRFFSEWVDPNSQQPGIVERDNIDIVLTKDVCFYIAIPLISNNTAGFQINFTID